MVYVVPPWVLSSVIEKLVSSVSRMLAILAWN